jgi:uncharacterized protein (TIGR03067 family)
MFGGEDSPRFNINLRFLMCVVVLLCVCCVTAISSDQAKDDAKKLQGSWKVIKAYRDGKEVDPSAVKDIRYLFNGDVMTFQSSREKNSAQFKLDAGKTPHWIDTRVLDGKAKGEIRLGIYEVSGERLKLCWSRSGTRPSTFTTKAGAPFFP